MQIERLREEFPIFRNPGRDGCRLAYLDSAATTQKPQCVIDALVEYYQYSNANVYRGVHYLSEQATLQFEAARETVRHFINARETRECIFVKGTTEAINLIARSFGNGFIQEGDEIIVSLMEHHANFVPWQMICQEKKAILKFIPMLPTGELDIQGLPELITEKTKLLAISYASNAFGTLHPVHDIIAMAHKKNVPVLIDAAQAISHLPIDVQALNCDFLAFSSHKAYGPTGIGILYGKAHWLEKLPPFQGGGEMIKKVSRDGVLFNDLPYKFEAGTPPIAEAIAFGKSLDFITNIGWENLQRHEEQLMSQAFEVLATTSGIQIVGNSNTRVPIISFLMEGIHPHDIGTIMDQNGVALRTGHHCAMPAMEFLDIPGTTRISLGIYNNTQDIEQFAHGLKQIQKIFKGARHATA